MRSLSQKSGPPPAGIRRFGFFAAVFTAAAALVTFAVALATPPISGPLAADPIAYPYTDILSRFPRDYFWMYPAMLLLFCFMALALALYHTAPSGRKPAAHAGLICAAASGMVLFADYFVQVSVVQPSLLAGETDGIALLTQYNPHGLFVVFEEIGYLLMSLSFLCFSFLFPAKNRLEAGLRHTLRAAFWLSVLSFAGICIALGLHREYLFEVAVISIDFLALIVFGFLAARRFRRTTPAT